MERKTGTTARGIRCPIIRKGDNLEQIVASSVLEAAKAENFQIRDRDIIAITESIVARAQGNYASVKDIADDVQAKFGDETVGVILPILSRNRFAICLRGIAMGVKKIVLMLDYPSDEVGNELVTLDMLDEAGIDPHNDVLTLQQYRELFGEPKHQITGVDYVAYYESIIKAAKAEVEIIFAHQPKAILDYTHYVLNCDIHTRERTKRLLLKAGAEKVYSLSDILSAPVNGNGYHKQYGLLGSNKSGELEVKLFPRPCHELLEGIQQRIRAETGKHVEVMVYGDGAFKDPVSGIYELADPEVSPYHTDGLYGSPNELKLKYLADNEHKQLQGAALEEAVRESIAKKSSNLKGRMESQGTTPREITNLIGSLCDLTSGSGDKGTPVVLVQGYFDDFSTN